MVARIALFASVAAVVGFASAQLQVLSPGGPDMWWVANSVNNVVWNCQQSQVQNFTILVANSDVKVLSGAEAIFAIEQNFDCSKALTVQQAAFVPATGYTVILANPLNSTDVYATSQPFEVKAQGSPYPTATPTTAGASSTGSGTGTATGAGGSSSTTPKSSGVILTKNFGLLGAAAGAVVLALAL